MKDSPPPTMCFDLWWDHQDQKWFVPGRPDLDPATVRGLLDLLASHKLLDMTVEQRAAYDRLPPSI